jgi:hypothetical protein
MTADNFNEKYKQYIPEGFYGLEFDIPVVTDYLDKVMQDLITIPGFELQQIKLKFGTARFYFDSSWTNKHLQAYLGLNIEQAIDKLIKDNA